MWRRGATVLGGSVGAMGGMRSRHVDTVGARVSRLRRVSQVRVEVFEVDHVGVGRVPRVRVLVVLGHQRHRDVADGARVGLHVRHLPDDLRHRRHLRTEDQVSVSRRCLPCRRPFRLRGFSSGFAGWIALRGTTLGAGLPRSCPSPASTCVRCRNEIFVPKGTPIHG